ncbi:patatin-like phospholipase family protein [Clostridium sp. ZS2-4]|uniref:patatin-like phospholipase family protein n=1 Tax=Clostridium sp. ZS2-4 TaxID=2987703 RepID=UPI00227B9E85|nr:patatin-like phospholipase family protein [Clostridium sp. ZS2-4]MCY6356837.1 patatin-like phospholipase family protein [Clostridium sp. ZS2-4]
MKCDAVFEGGGIRGIGMIGALNYFEKRGYNWRKVAGTSVGAIIASFIAAGYTAKEIENIMAETDFLKFLDRERVQKIPVVGKALGVLKEKAIYSGSYFERWMDEMLSRKGVSKFKHVCKEGKCNLKVVASDITRKKILILPDDLYNYGFYPMEFKISKAVRMSMSIPLYFKPIKLKYKGGTSYIVDGGVCWNYPISIFDINGIPEVPTIGFKFKNVITSNTLESKTDTIAYLLDVANTMCAKRNDKCLNQEDKSRTVFIPTLGVDVTDFNISKQKSIRLFKSGYRAAKEFLKGWDFEEYIKEYRKVSV